MHFSIGLTGIHNAIGVSNAKRVSSCLKALSSLKAYTMPHQEFFAACQALVSPRLPLWGFCLMSYGVVKIIAYAKTVA